MSRPKYRYRPIHALAERLVSFIALLTPEPRTATLSVVPRKVLVLKFGGMGEAVLARSLMESLQQRNPAMHVDYLLEDRTEDVMAGGTQGKIFKYSPRSDGFGKALKTLLSVRRQRYDAILDFEQDSLLTAAFARATSIPVRTGFSPTATHPRRRMFTHPIELREMDSMWRSVIRIGRVLDPELPDSLMTVPLPVGKESVEAMDQWWRTRVGAGNKQRVVAMHIGVGPSAQYRRWPLERYLDLASVLAGYEKELIIALTGSRSEQPLIHDFQSRFSGRSVDASELGSIERVGAFLRRCDLLISNDTGIMHLGAAMGAPTIGLFGASNPVWWAPVGPKAAYLYKTGLPCSPCINTYLRQIPPACTAADEGACMKEISVEDVVRAARSVISESWLG